MAAPAKKTVELFYDVVSPYTWFAFEVLCRYQNRWNIDLKLKPFFLGGIMNETGNKPPAMVPKKGVYLLKEMPLLAKYFDVPIKQPADVAEVMFVKGTLSTQRFITSVDLATEGRLTENISRELWMRIWNRDEDITQPDSFRQAGKLAGMSVDQVEKCLGMMKDPAVKDRLKQYSSEALEHGAFGSPTIVAHIGKPVMFFGSDRFPVLAQVLGEKWEGPQPGRPNSHL